MGGGGTWCFTKHGTPNMIINSNKLTNMNSDPKLRLKPKLKPDPKKIISIQNTVCIYLSRTRLLYNLSSNRSLLVMSASARFLSNPSWNLHQEKTSAVYLHQYKCSVRIQSDPLLLGPRSESVIIWPGSCSCFLFSTTLLSNWYFSLHISDRRQSTSATASYTLYNV